MNCSATRSPASRAVIASCGDLRGDALLLVERERDGRDVVREGRLRRRNGRDHDLVARVEEVLHHHHGVVPLLDRLPVEVRRELRQRLRVVVDGDRDVLLRRGELVRDLLVEFLLKGCHGRNLSRRRAAGRPPPGRREGEAGLMAVEG